MTMVMLLQQAACNHEERLKHIFGRWMHYWDLKSLGVGGHGRGGVIPSLFVLVIWHFSGWQTMVYKGHAFDVGIL